MIAKLFVEIGADIKDLTKGIGDAEHTLKRFSKNVGQLGKTLTTRLTLPLATMGAGVVKLASDFESSFADIRKTVDATDMQFQEIEKGLRNLAKEITTPVEELNKLAGVAGQLGVKANDIVEFTKVMAMLGDTTNVSGEEASLSLARFMNIMGTSQSEVSNLGSAIVELGNNFASMESEIIMIGTSLASFGSALKLSESDVLAFATAIASSGGNVEASATAFQKTAFTIRDAVLTGNEDLAVFAETASMTVEEFSDSFRKDAGQAIVQFLAGLKKISDQGQSTTVVLDKLGLADQRLQREFGKVIANLDQLNQAFVVANKGFNENTALTEEAQKRYETFASQILILKNELKDIGITFGTDLLPILRDGIDVIRDMSETFSNMSKDSREAITKLAVVLGVTAPLMVALSAMISSFLTIKKVAVPLFTVLVKGFSNLNPYVKAIVLAIAGVKAVFELLPESVQDSMKKSVDYVKNGFKDMEKIKLGGGFLTAIARQSVPNVEPEVVILEENIVIPDVELDFTKIVVKPITVPIEPDLKMLDNLEELVDLDLGMVDMGTIAGSVGGLTQNIREFQDLQSRATNPEVIKAYQNQIEQLQAQIRQLGREAKTFGDTMLNFGENAVKGFVDATLNGFFNALLGVQQFNTQELELRKMSLQEQQLALQESLANQEIDREEFNLRMALLNQDLLDTETQIAQARENVFKKSLRNMGDAVKSFVKEALVELAKLAILSVIGKFLGLGTIGSTKDLASGVFDKIKGRRTGGFARKNSPHFVGEQGMELFIPNTSGTVMNNNDLMNTFSRGQSTTQNIKLGGEFKINGTDLVLALSEANYQLGR